MLEYVQELDANRRHFAVLSYMGGSVWKALGCICTFGEGKESCRSIFLPRTRFQDTTIKTSIGIQ